MPSQISDFPELLLLSAADRIAMANGTGSDLNRWQRRYRYFVVLHVGAACDLLGHRGHCSCNGAAYTTLLRRRSGWRSSPVGQPLPEK
jgi:hypothetical protein